MADRDRDILKLTVVNRYQAAPPAIALIHSFGLQRGAIAASIAHDSHNIVALGTNDADLCAAVNAVILYSQDCEFVSLFVSEFPEKSGQI